jgi:methyltransferase (TIGR00027 family)
VRWFEVDHPATQAEKRRRLAAPEVTYVPLDLITGDLAGALGRTGFEDDNPAMFLAEGLTMYLDQVTCGALLAGIAAVAPAGSWLAVDFSQGGGSISLPSRIVASAIRRSFEYRGERRFDWADEATARDLLEAAGWTVTDISTGPVLAERYLRGTSLRTAGISPSASCVMARKT